MSYHGVGVFGAGDEETDTYDPNQAFPAGMVFEQTDTQLNQQADAQPTGPAPVTWNPTPGTVGPSGQIAPQPAPAATAYKPPSVPAPKPGFSIASLMQGKTPWILGGVAIAVVLLAMAGKKKPAHARA